MSQPKYNHNHDQQQTSSGTMSSPSNNNNNTNQYVMPKSEVNASDHISSQNQSVSEVNNQWTTMLGASSQDDSSQFKHHQTKISGDKQQQPNRINNQNRNNNIHIHHTTDHHSAKKKKIRTIFTAAQIMRLNEEFDRNTYLSSNDRVRVAKELNLAESQVKVWFQNKRNKHKRNNEFVSSIQAAMTKTFALLSQSANSSNATAASAAAAATFSGSLGHQTYHANLPNNNFGNINVPTSARCIPNRFDALFGWPQTTGYTEALNAIMSYNQYKYQNIN